MTTLDKIFKINYGSDLELNKLDQTNGNIRFVSRTRKNNGVSALVNEYKDATINPPNTISVALGSSSVLFAFFQEQPYYSGRDVAFLEPLKEMTKQEMLYYCACITANRYKYNFGRQANKTIATLKVPDKNEIPQWVNNTQIQDLNHLNEPLITQDIISQKSYKIFEFSQLFKFANEEKHDKITTVNLVSALTKNNGIKGVVNTNSYIDGNKLTITSNGIYTGTAFYQEKPFVTQDSIAIELIGHKLNKYIAMYLICLINNEKFRFNYGRKSNKTKLEQLKLELPTITPNQPDWEFMERYIKSLPYSKNI